MRVRSACLAVLLLAALPATASAAPPMSGTVLWDRRRSRVRARLRLDGAVQGRLRIRWRTDARRAVASIVGTLAGRPVRLRTPAP